MSAEIRTLKDGETTVYPRTLASAVQNSDGTTIDTTIQNAINSTNELVGDIDTALNNILISNYETVTCKITNNYSLPLSIYYMDKTGKSVPLSNYKNEEIQILKNSILVIRQVNSSMSNLIITKGVELITLADDKDTWHVYIGINQNFEIICELKS